MPSKLFILCFQPRYPSLCWPLDDQQVWPCMDCLRQTSVSQVVLCRRSLGRTSCNWSTSASRYHIGTASARQSSQWTASPTLRDLPSSVDRRHRLSRPCEVWRTEDCCVSLRGMKPWNLPRGCEGDMGHRGEFSFRGKRLSVRFPTFTLSPRIGQTTKL